MTEVREGELLVTISTAAHARKFDGRDHGLSRCMKAVDFVIEEDDRLILLEIKDFDHGRAPSRSSPGTGGKHERDVRAWIGKFRDSLLYPWAERRLGSYRECCVVLECRSLDPALRLALQDLFERLLPAASRSPAAVEKRWKDAPVHRRAVLDLAGWNRRMPAFPMRRDRQAPPKNEERAPQPPPRREGAGEAPPRAVS